MAVHKGEVLLIVQLITENCNLFILEINMQNT